METGLRRRKLNIRNEQKMENVKENKPVTDVSGKNRFLDFLRLGEVGGYFFRKKDPSRPSNINIRMMHGVNKISILIFLIGIIYLILKRFL